MFDGPQRATGLAGVNALYFKGLWKDRFDAKLTQVRPFHLVGGGSSDVPLMMRIGGYRHREDGRFVAVDLPYRNERFGLVVATTNDRPASAAEFASVGDWLTGEAFVPGRVDLSLPRFTMTEGAEILEALDAAGLKAGRHVADLVRAAVLGSARRCRGSRNGPICGWTRKAPKPRPPPRSR